MGNVEKSMETRWKRIAAVATLGNVTDITDWTLISTLVAILAAIWRLSPVEVGLIVAAHNLGAIFGAIVQGPIADYIGRKPMWVISNFFTGCIWIAAAFSPGWQVLYVCRVLTGFVASFSQAAFYPLIAESVPAERRGRIFMWARALISIGAGLFSNSLITLTGMYGWPWYYMVLAIAAFNIAVALLGIVALPESPIWRKRVDAIQQGKLKEARVPLKLFAKGEYLKRLVIAIFVNAIGGQIVVLPVYVGVYFATSVLQVPLAVIGLIGLAGTFVGAVGAIVCGRLADRIGRTRTLIVYILLIFIALQFQFRTIYFLPAGTLQSWIFYYAFAWLYSFCLGSFWELSALWTNELFPTGIRATAEGIVFTLGWIFLWLANTLSGYVAGALGIVEGYTIYSYIGAVLILIPMGIAIKKGYETKGISMEF